MVPKGMDEQMDAIFTEEKLSSLSIQLHSHFHMAGPINENNLVLQGGGKTTRSVNKR